MENKEKTKIVFLTLIIGRKQKDALLNELSGLNVQLINTLYGEGSVKAGYLKKMFGFIPEERKAVITCLLSDSHLDSVFSILVEKFSFDKPNTGIAFTVPVDELSF